MILKDYFTRRSVSAILAVLALTFAFSEAARAQTVIPRVCVENGTAYWGYNNTSNAVVTIPKGQINVNFFSPGPSTYTAQPTQFQPGIHEAVFTTPAFSGQTGITWYLSNDTATASNSEAVRCAKITYQGRLTDAGASANGQYDLQFTAYDTLTGGTAKSDTVTVDGAQVTNGIFTVQLNFGASLINNSTAKFLEIGVRAGDSTGAFTVLTPRQPLNSVPFAVNAASASSVRLPVVNNAPPSSSCSAASDYGQMQVSTTRLYICTPEGWKSVTLQ